LRAGNLQVTENNANVFFGTERLNTKIRVIQRRAYGIKNSEYLRLKALTFIEDDLYD